MFDLGNTAFERWLCCDQSKRERLVSKVLQQLTEICASGDSVRRALQQITQHTEVHLHRVTLEEIRMYTQRHGDQHFQDSLCVDYRPSTRVNGYGQPPKYHIIDDRRYRYRASESSEVYADRHMKKEVCDRKRKIYSNHDSNGRRCHGFDGKMQKIVHEKPKTASSVPRPNRSLKCKNLKDSDNIECDMRREKYPSLQGHDLATCSGMKTNVTGSADTSGTSDLGKQTHTSTVKGTDRTLPVRRLSYESGKDCCVKGNLFRVLSAVNREVVKSATVQEEEERVAPYKVQSACTEKGKVPRSSNKSLSTQENEHCFTQKDFISAVNRVEVEVNPQESIVKQENHLCVISEIVHHADSNMSAFTGKRMFPVEQKTEETSGASGSQCRTGRICIDSAEGTKSSGCRKLNEMAKTGENDVQKLHRLSKDANEGCAMGHEKANCSVVSHLESGYLKENASVPSHTSSGDEVGCSKIKVTGVGKTVDQTSTESKHAGKSQILADERKVALHCSSGHAGLEGCASKSQQGQQNVVHRVTAEETTHQGSKLQLMVPEIREMDGEKCKASHDSCLSDDEHGTHVTESDFVEKTMKREVKLSSNLVSKDRCEMDQSVPYNSSVSEAKKYAKSLPKYPGVRRLSLQYYTTIGEYFGKDLFKTDDEIKHATKDCGRNLREKEFTSNGQNPRENMVKTVIKKEKPSVKVSSQCSKTGQQAPANVEKSLVKESQQCSSEFQASSHCKRNESSLLLLKGKNRRKTSEDITNTNITNLTKNTNMSELDLKCVKNKKKRKRILELFGEDPDEPSGKKSDSDGLGMKVLQGNNARSVSTKVSDRFANTSELDTRLKDTGSRVCQPITISHKHAPEMSSFVKGTLRHSDENKTKESVDQQSASSHHEGGVQKQVSRKSVLVMKGNDCGGCHELELSVTCSTKEGTDSGTMALDDRLKHDESSSLTHKSDIHLTGSITEGTNGDFHLIINMGITDALFPGPEKCQSAIGVKLPSSVNCYVAKDVNEASNGHSTNMEGHVSAEESIEIADVPLGTVERVAEKRVVSAGGSENVSVINIPEVALLHRDETGSVDTHVLSVPHNACAEQNPPGNQHHTVTSSRSEPPVSLVPLDRGSVTDSASESQVLSVPEQTKQIEDQIFDIYAETSSSQSLPEEGMAIRKEKETGKGVVHDEDIQRKSDTVGKNKSLPESNAVLTVACRRESCNISQSPVDPNQSQSSAALEKNSSSSGEASSSDGCQSSVGSDQLPNGLLGVNSPTTNLSQSVVSPQTSSNTNDIPDVVGAPASHNLLRIRVRDPESLGITRPRSSFFEIMDTKLRELTEVTYILLQDIVRFKQRFEALSRLTGSLRDSERALAQAEFANPHQILKTKTFLGLYKYIEKSFSGETEAFLIKRLSELNPGWTYTSELLKKCWNYCIWVYRNSENNVVNSDHTSGQATVSSFPYRQQYQQQPVGVPLPNNVAGSATSVLTTLLEGGRQTSLSSEANLNSKQQSSASVDNVASLAQIQHTSGRKEIVTNTAGFVMKPPSHDRLMREAGTNLNTRHAQVRNIFHQHPTYNRLQAPNSSRIFQTHSDSNSHVPQLVPAGDRAIPPNPYVPQTVPATDRTIPPSVYLPHTVSATDRTIPLAHVPVSNAPSQTRTVSRLLSHTCREQSTVQPAVAGCASGYSQPNVFSHSYPPNQRGTASFNTPNTLYSPNRAVEQGTSTQRNSDILQNTNRRVTYPNGSTQQGRILNVVNQNTVLSKSASNSFSQPYPRNSAIQQDTVSQAVRNSVSDKCTATRFSQHYPRNAIQQGTFCRVNNVYPVASAPNSYCYSYPQSETVQQGTFSQPVSSTSTDMSVPNPFSQSYANNVAVALPGTAPYPSGYPNQPNQASTYHLSNDPSSSLTGSAQNVLLNAGYVHQTRNNRFHSPSSYSAQSSSYTQQLRPVMLQSEQRVNVQEHHASVGQGNGKFYSRVSCGLCQQHQAPPVASGSELQSCGTPQSVSSRRRSYGKGNANITASNNFCEGRNMQNVPAGSGISYSGHNRSGYLGNNTASNSQSDKRKSEGVFLASSAASDRLCDVASAQSEPVSSSISRRENICVSVANSRETNILSDRGNNQRSGYIVNSTTSHSVCDKGNSEGVSLANSAASDRLSDVASAQNEPASSSLSRRENNCVSVADRTETNSLSDRGNNQCSGYIVNSTASHSVCDKGNSEGISLANSAASDRLSDVASAQNEPASSSLCRRENNSVSVADRTETNSISDRGNNQRSGIFANSTTNNNVYDSGRNKTQPLASTATNDSVSDTGKSQNGSFLNSTAGDGLSVCENSHSVPPAVVDIPSLIPLQARLEDVNQQSNRLTEKEPACDAGKQIMSSIIQDISGAPITGNCGEVTLRTYRKRTNDAESINQSERVEVFGCTKDVQVGAEFGGAEDAHLVENVVGRKDKCVSNGILAKHLSSHSSLSDPETGLRSDVAGEEGNSSTAEVASELLEEREVTILTDCVCVPISTPESCEMSASLNNTLADITEEAAGSDNNREPESEIEVLYEVLPQPRTVSRDSGYTTPSPMVGNVSVRDNQKVTINMYKPEDELLVGEEYEEHKPYLEESEDNEDKKLMTWIECEDPIPTWCDTEETLLTWHESKVASLRERVIQCAVCEKAAEVKCSGCLVTCYCSAECQLEDWNAIHHTVCCAVLDN